MVLFPLAITFLTFFYLNPLGLILPLPQCLSTIFSLNGWMNELD